MQQQMGRIAPLLIAMDPESLIRRILTSGTFHLLILETHGLAVRALYLSKASSHQSFEPAVHRTATDTYVVLRGEGELTRGGTLIGGQPRVGDIDADTIRGNSIRGGTIQTIHPFGVFSIPPGTPHMVALRESQEEVLLYNFKTTPWTAG